MSKRNTDPEERKRRKLLKQLRATPEAYIDLIHYVRIRTNCTASMAAKVLLAGALRVDSHPVGYKWQKDLTGKSVKVLDPYLPAKYRDQIVVQWNPEEAK